MAYSVFAEGTASVVAGGTSMTPGLPAGTLTGKLLILVAASSANASVTDPGDPTNWTRIDTHTGNGLCVWGRVGTASESAPTVAAFSTGAGGARITAFTSHTGLWPSIGSILQSETKSTPANSASLGYGAHTVAANGNMLIRIGKKGGSSVGETVSSVATNSGYTQCNFFSRSNQTLGMGCAIEMLTANTAVGVDATAQDVAFTTWSASRGREAICLELKSATAGSVSLGASTYKASSVLDGVTTTVLIEATKDSSYTAAPTATLAGVSLTRDSYSGAVAYFRMPLTSLFENGQSFAAVAWKTNVTLAVSDLGGPYNATMQIYPPNEDCYDVLAGGSFDYAPATSANGDTCYVDISVGNGEGLPIIASLQGNTVPTTAAFRVYKGAAWLAAVSHTFNVASAALDGQFADSFTDADNTDIDAHTVTPTPLVSGRKWIVDRDLSTQAAPSADSVNIVSNRLVITDAQEGAAYDVGTVNPDLTVQWVCTADLNRFTIHTRRKDDTAHVHLFIKKFSEGADGEMTINQRVASSNIEMSGTTTVSNLTYTAGVTYSIRVYVVGSSFKVYLNDVLILNAISSISADSAATYIGLFSGGSAFLGSGITFDSVNVYSDYTVARGLTFGAVVP